MVYKTVNLKLEQNYWEPIDKCLLYPYSLPWEKLEFIYHVYSMIGRYFAEGKKKEFERKNGKQR